METLFIIAQSSVNSPGEAVRSLGIVDYKRTGSFITLKKKYLVCRLTVNICASLSLLLSLPSGYF